MFFLSADVKALNTTQSTDPNPLLGLILYSFTTRLLGILCPCMALCFNKGSNPATWSHPETGHPNYVNFSGGMPYLSMLFAANLTTLASCRDDISRKFFCNITKSTSCLHHLISDPKMESHNSRLRSCEKFLRVYTCTKRYCSFIQHALGHYQDRVQNN